ncbi:hypothetical protein [Burkholderia plantarii]|uniref:hypothetical protein n=1 Tax=Burkholderia plantarii TaxID=41899 RepID=UPI002729D6FF|nr:hypothetical protein [Burkholderia plantarii]
MVRKFGDAIATALSGSANAAELTPAQGGAPVISATGQRLNPAAPAGASPAAPQGAPASAPGAPSGDPLLDMAAGLMKGGGAQPAASPAPAAPASAAVAPPADPLLAMAQGVMAKGGTPPAAGSGAGAGAKSGPAAASAAQPHETTPLDVAGAAVEPLATLATGALGSVVGGIGRLGAAALGDSFGDAKALGNRLSSALTYQPQTQGGQQALAGLGQMATNAKNAIMNTPVGNALSAIGKKYDETFVNGGQGPLMATINDMVPAATANVVGGKLAATALDALPGASNALKAAITKPEPAPVRAEPTMPAPASKPRVVPNGDGTFTEVPPPAGPAPAPTPAPTPGPAPGAGQAPSAAGSSAPPAASPTAASGSGSTLRGVGAAETNLNPYAGQLTGEEAARGGSSAFPQVKVAKGSGDVAPAEQAVRAQIANEVLGPENDAVRTGVITGNEDTLRSEYTNAKSPDNTPAQLVLRDQIAREQQALSNYAQDRIAATGANPNLINNEQRGLAINDALYGPDSLNDYFQQAKNQIYDNARAQTGANPIQSTHVDELLKDPQFLAEAERNGHTGVVSGVQRLIELARTTGFKDPITGEVTPPGSVAAWDAVRKSNNAGWTPDNSRTIAAVNRAIDQDVAAAAGSESYKLGDAVHQAQKTLLDAPGIAKVFGDADANGIKGGVAFEKLPQKLNNLPLDQWRHVYNTLDDLSRGQIRGAPEGMPPVPLETQQLAVAARDEMKGALAREVYEQGAGKTGVWNQNSVNKTLNSVVGQKITETFSPDEVARFHALNYAGQIMPGVHSYEGAGLQASRLDKPGFIEKYAPGTAYIAGTKVAGPIGGWLSEKGANLLTSNMKEKRLIGRGNQLMDAMRANSKIGKN